MQDVATYVALRRCDCWMQIHSKEKRMALFGLQTRYEPFDRGCFWPSILWQNTNVCGFLCGYVAKPIPLHLNVGCQKWWLCECGKDETTTTTQPMDVDFGTTFLPNHTTPYDPCRFVEEGSPVPKVATPTKSIRWYFRGQSTCVLFYVLFCVFVFSNVCFCLDKEPTVPCNPPFFVLSFAEQTKEPAIENEFCEEESSREPRFPS